MTAIQLRNISSKRSYKANKYGKTNASYFVVLADEFWLLLVNQDNINVDEILNM